jgi:hypothetical protein
VSKRRRNADLSFMRGSMRGSVTDRPDLPFMGGSITDRP